MRESYGICAHLLMWLFSPLLHICHEVHELFPSFVAKTHITHLPQVQQQWCQQIMDWNCQTVSWNKPFLLIRWLSWVCVAVTKSWLIHLGVFYKWNDFFKMRSHTQCWLDQNLVSCFLLLWIISVFQKDFRKLLPWYCLLCKKKKKKKASKEGRKKRSKQASVVLLLILPIESHCSD